MPQTSVMHVIGVDACRGGWVAVTLNGPLAGGSFAGVYVSGSLAGCLSEAGLTEGTVTGVDMALGLLECGWRTADERARRLLGPRRSSVFAIPPRPVWEQPSYAGAGQACREITGKGVSIQAWGLRTRLLEANAYCATGRHPLYEVHPELAFMALAGGVPLADSKHTPRGRERRRELLTAAGITVPVTPRVTDVLDAAAVAWSAQRIANGTGVTLPDPPQHDRDGYEIAIRY
jgi:predicted RNase H-like nuclease